MQKVKVIINKPIIKLVFLFLFLILSFGFLRHNFSARASDEKINLYPESFSVESNAAALKNPGIKDGSLWQDAEKALSAQEGQLTDFHSFNGDNSVALNFGSGSFPTTTAEEINSTSSVDQITATGTVPEISSSSLPVAPETAIYDQIIATSSDGTESSTSSVDSNNSSASGDSSTSSTEMPVVQNHLPEASPASTAGAPAAADDNSVLTPADNSSPSNFDNTRQNDNNPAPSSPADSGLGGNDNSAPISPASSGSSVDNNSAPVPIDVDQPVIDSGASAGPVSLLNLKNTAGEMGKFWHNLISAPVVLAQDSVAPIEIPVETKSSSSTAELKDSLIFSDFTVDSYSPSSEITNVQLRLSLSAQSTFVFDHLLVEYSTGGDWQTAGDLFIKGGLSNAKNGGYFLYALPIFSSWDDVNNLRVRISYQNSELSADDLQNKTAKVYLDGIWLEVDYNQGRVLGAREKNNLPAAGLSGEKHFFNEDSLTVDGKSIDFAYTDVTDNENLIIKTDHYDYTGFTQAPVYFSVTNNGEQAENFGLQTYFPANNGRMSNLQRLSRQYATREVPIRGSRIYYCAAAWQTISASSTAVSTSSRATSTSWQATSTENYFSCAKKNKTRQCDSLSTDGKKCSENNAVIATTTEEENVDQWNDVQVFAGKLADKRNLWQKIFGLGPRHKSVPDNFSPKNSTAAEKFNIAPGETEYFKMDIAFTPWSSGEFYLETVGDKSGYGLLDPWWNASWDFEVPVTVTYAGSNPLTNFQVAVTIDTATLIAAGKLKSDCSDIAFADSNLNSDTSQLNYYLEPGTCNKSYTKVWVKIPSLSATKTIYLLYGNNSAASYSSGANTFVYFNDFESGAGFNAGLLNPTQYVKSAKYGSYGLNGNGASNSRLETINGSTATGRNLIWEAWVKGESSSTKSSLAGITIGHPNGNTVSGYQAVISKVANQYLAITKDYATSSALVFSSTAAVADNTWYFLQFQWRSTNVLWASLFAGSTTTYPVLACSSTDASYSDGEYGVAANQIGDWENYRIRKYASSSVTTALGSEVKVVNHPPLNPFSMGQYGRSTSSAIINGGWTNQSTINLTSTSTDKDGNAINVYYQLATTSGSLLTATSAPSNICKSGTAYTACPSRVWANGNYGDWFDTRYTYRQKITFGINHSALPVGYTATTTMDTRPANTHVALVSGNDVRIVWQSSTTPPVEIDRIGDTWNSATTHIQFKIQAAVGANVNDPNAGSYYVYYGYASAGTPPVNPVNVYYEYDPFNGGSLGSEWSTIDKSNTGTATIVVTSTLKIASNGADVWTSPNDYYAAIYRTVPGNFEVTTRVQYQGPINAWTKTGIMIKNNMAATQANNGYSVMVVTPSNSFDAQWDSNADAYLDSYNGGGATAYPDCLRMRKSGTSFLPAYSTNCSTFTALAVMTMADANTASQHVGLFNTSHDAVLPSSSYFNWIKIRLLVAVDENATQGAEESFANAWYNTSYPYRMLIAVQASKIGGALTNFPTYLNMARVGGMNTNNSFWQHTKRNSDGGDILITNSSGTRMPVEVVSLSTSTASGEVYFRADAISSSSNITYYLYYGSSTASQPASSTTYGSQNVWSNGYGGVWHLGSLLRDSRNGILGSDNGSRSTSAVSMIGATSRQYVSANTQRTNFGSSSPINITGLNPITLEGWVRYSDLNANYETWFGKSDLQYFLQKSNANPGTNRFCIYDGAWECVNSDSTVAASTWYYVVGTYIGTSAGAVNLYINGVLQAAAITANGITNSNNNVWLGGDQQNAGRYLNGFADEARISSVSRSVKWISTQYNNMSSPGTFIVTSSAQSYLASKKIVNIPSVPDSTGYKWQALACDSQGACSNWAAYNLSTPNFSVDTVSPAFSNAFSFLASTTNSLKLSYPTAVTETNFSQYKIYWRLGSTTPIHESDNVISSSTAGYSYLGYQNFQGKSSTTLSGLTTSTVYSFSLWGYDKAGNKSSTTLAWERTDRLPNTLIFNSVAGEINATGRVDVSLAINDIDLETQAKAKVEYFTNQYCHSASIKPTLSESDPDTVATFGDPKLQNKNTYQIGTSTGWILTNSGQNTVNFVWLSKTDLPVADGIYCLKITVDDNRGGYKIATTSLIVDNVAPSGVGSLTFNKAGGAFIVANFGTAMSDSNFYQYVIHYKQGAVGGVKETDPAFGPASDPALGDLFYLTHSTTSVNGLNGNTQYFFNIFAYDIFGNRASGTTEFSASTLGLPNNATSLAQYQADGVTTIGNNTWLNVSEVTLYATSTDGGNNPIKIYYQLATSSGSYKPSTSTPSNACSSGTTYASCPNRIWYASKAVKADLKGIPSGNYKWEALACTLNGCAKNWTIFNATIPNFKLDTSAPTSPGALTFISKGATSVKMNFGSQTIEPNFVQYKIFYKQGVSGVKETDSLFSSSSDTSLGHIDYNGKSSTTISGLTAGSSYVFNIFAYDVYGLRASGSFELLVNLGSAPALAFNLQQYDYAQNSMLNAAWNNHNSVYFSATSSDSNPLSLYYQLASTSGSFISATTTPASYCVSGTIYASCPSRIWAILSANWWNGNYGYRRKITFGTNHSLLPVGYTASTTIDTRTANTKVALASGDDVRIVWQSTTSAPVEIDRLGDTWNNASTHIQFKIQAAVQANISDPNAGSYYVYYGNSSAGSPPANQANIYYEYDAFNNSSLGAEWTTIDKASAAGTTFTETSSLKIYNAGTDVWLTPNDYYAGVYRSVPGNFEATARIIYQTNSNGWAKAGIMVKNNMAVTQANNGYGIIAVTPGSNFSEQYDSNGDGYLDLDSEAGATAYPDCVRMVKKGTNFTPYYSTNCTAFTAMAVITPSGVNTDLQNVGLFNSSHDVAVLNATTFSYMKIRLLVNTSENSTQGTEETWIANKRVNITSMPENGYKWQALACNTVSCSRNWTSFNSSVPNFYIDTVAPSAPGPLVLVSRRTNSITLGFGSPVYEINFRQYKVFYKAGSDAPKELDYSYTSSTDSNLAYLNYNNEPSFTISPLSANTTYSFNIWAYDWAGNKSSSTNASFSTSNALTQVYYYTSGTNQGWINSSYAWDNVNNTYAYRSVPGNLVDDSVYYLQGTANNTATTSTSILGVELGLEGYSANPTRINYKVIPVLRGLTVGSTYTLAGTLFGKTDSDNTFYSDVTYSANAPSHWNWDDLQNLDARVYVLNASTTAVLTDVDQIRLRVTIDSYPDGAKNLNQYQSNNVTTITNGAYLNQKNITLYGQATDPDPSESLSIYYQFATTSGSFITSTAKPIGACVSGVSYANCSSKVWVVSYSGAFKDFSATPFTGTTSIANIPDGTYKWQTLVCDASDICSAWSPFNATTPNITIDNTAPVVPGKLTFTSHTSGTMTVHFGSVSSDTNFYRYRIFYKKSSTSPVTELDSEQSDSNLNAVNFNNIPTTTIAGLAKSSWYTFNIWAYDLAGNKASATPALIATTTPGYILTQTSYLIENDDSVIGVNANTSPVATNTPLTNVEKGQRLNIRTQIQNTGGDQTYNKRFKIQYENNTDAPGVWTDVGAATPISYSYGLSGSNGDLITIRKAAKNPTRTWQNGLWQENTNLSDMYNLATGYFTELVFAVQTVNATVGKTYRLRLIDGTGSSTLDVYSVYPTLNMISVTAKKYSKNTPASLPVNFVDLVYFLDNPGYANVLSDNSVYDTIVSSAGQYPVYNFAARDWSSSYALNVSWNGQSNVAPTSNKATLQIYRFGSVNAWATVASNTTASAGTDFTLGGTIDYHISEYLNNGLVYWRVYQNSGAETLSSDYFSFTTSSPAAYVTGRHYRWRNDDAAYGSWRQTEDTPDPTAGSPIAKNTNIRLRMSFTDTKAGSASNYTFGLQYATTTTNCSGTLSPWYMVRSSAATSTLQFQIAYSPQFSNASTTGSQLSTNSYTYTTGRMVNYISSTSAAITMAEDQDTEVEWSIKATANAKAGQTYCFRGVNNGTALDAYDRYAELTVAGTTNTAPSFTQGPSDSGSASTSPTAYGQNVTFIATSTDPQSDQYYLAICQTNAVVAGNGGAPACSGGSWCISSRASSTKGASCTANTNHFYSQSYVWYAFVCDYRYGAGVAQCSAVAQGQPGTANASPFNVNHPPIFSAVTTLNDYKDPGATINIQATTADTDTNSNWSYYVCTANSATAAGCTGGAPNTVCSAVATTTVNPICHHPVTIPTVSGAYTYYAFVYDNFSLGATTSPAISTYHINNTAPYLGALSINGNSNITLNIKGAADKQVLLVNTSVSDLNGCQTLVSAVATAYRTSLGYNCSANDNNCYQISTANCVLSDCTGPADALATYTCTTNFKFFAEPTDNTTNNPWSADTWTGRLQVYDGSNYGATTTPAIEVNTNSALDVTSKIISFGNVDPGFDTGTVNQTSTIVNFGNSPLNSNISGSDLNGKIASTLASTYIHWNLTKDFNYPTGNTLKNGGELVTVNIAKPNSPATSSNQVYWGVGIPAVVTHTTFTGTSTFTAVLNGAGW